MWFNQLQLQLQLLVSDNIQLQIQLLRNVINYTNYQLQIKNVKHSFKRQLAM